MPHQRDGQSRRRGRRRSEKETCRVSMRSAGVFASGCVTCVCGESERLELRDLIYIPARIEVSRKQ